jgi:4,5-DOPA dioxygenase extradiol
MSSYRPDRRGILKAALGVATTLPFLGCRDSARAARPAQEGASAMTTSTSVQRMPVLFIGHGSPMNAIEENTWTQGFRSLAEQLPKPKAILSISAHWFLSGTFLTGNEHPPTIHDFGGFPRALYEMQYPAPGSIELAQRVVKLLGASRASVQNDWGLDHGTWTVLHHLRPKADVPVVQLSIDARLAPSEHLALGRALAGLRDEGVLVMGSGNVTHNLRHAFSSMQSGNLTTPQWAERFDADVARAFEQHDGAFLARVIETDAGRMSHPSIDHFLPMLYVAGAAHDQEPVRFPVSGFDLGSLSMRSVLIG